MLHVPCVPSKKISPNRDFTGWYTKAAVLRDRPQPIEELRAEVGMDHFACRAMNRCIAEHTGNLHRNLWATPITSYPTANFGLGYRQSAIPGMLLLKT